MKVEVPEQTPHYGLDVWDVGKVGVKFIHSINLEILTEENMGVGEQRHSLYESWKLAWEILKSPVLRSELACGSDRKVFTEQVEKNVRKNTSPVTIER